MRKIADGEWDEEIEKALGDAIAQALDDFGPASRSLHVPRSKRPGGWDAGAPTALAPGWPPGSGRAQ
jgi:hypothetical protein